MTASSGTRTDLVGLVFIVDGKKLDDAQELPKPDGCERLDGRTFDSLLAVASSGFGFPAARSSLSRASPTAGRRLGALLDDLALPTDGAIWPLEANGDQPSMHSVWALGRRTRDGRTVRATGRVRSYRFSSAALIASGVRFTSHKARNSSRVGGTLLDVTSRNCSVGRATRAWSSGAGGVISEPWMYE